MFSIVTFPELPAGPSWTGSPTIPVDNIFWYLEDADHTKFDLVYLFDEKQIQYYPANLGQVLNDLLRALSLIREGRSHSIEFSGYTVALADISDHIISFYDPGGKVPSRERIGSTTVEKYIDELSRMIGSIVKYIREINPSLL